MYNIYSSKNKKLGNLSEDGKLITSNKKLKLIYDTMLNFGVFSLSINSVGKKVEVIRKKVIKEDGNIFVKAIITNLESLGFTIISNKE